MNGYAAEELVVGRGRPACRGSASARGGRARACRPAGSPARPARASAGAPATVRRWWVRTAALGQPGVEIGGRRRGDHPQCIPGPGMRARQARRARALPARTVGGDGCGCSSTRRRPTGSTACSRSSTTAGSTRCSGRRRCATSRSRRAALDDRSLRTLDVGAGTGFTTEGIVERVDPACVTMLDQSPHQLARARAKPALERCEKLLGDAEALPFADGRFDRYVSAGSIEYWPDPQRALAEAHRVLRPGGRALVDRAGPACQPAAARARRRLDAVPDRGRVPRLDERRRLRRRRARAGGARVVPQHARCRTRSRRAAEAEARASGPPLAPPSPPRETLRRAPRGRPRACARRSASPPARSPAPSSSRSRRRSCCATGWQRRRTA